MKLHLEVDVGVEYLGPEAHVGRHERVALRHIDDQLKVPALKGCVNRALRPSEYSIFQGLKIIRTHQRKLTPWRAMTQDFGA